MHQKIIEPVPERGAGGQVRWIHSQPTSSQDMLIAIKLHSLSVSMSSIQSSVTEAGLRSTIHLRRWVTAQDVTGNTFEKDCWERREQNLGPVESA